MCPRWRTADRGLGTETLDGFEGSRGLTIELTSNKSYSVVIIGGRPINREKKSLGKG